MRVSRRAWLRAVAAGAVGGLAGCAGDQSGSTTASSSSTATATTDVSTDPSTTDASTTDASTTEPSSDDEWAELLGEPDEETEHAFVFRDVPFRETPDGTLAIDYYHPKEASGPVPVVVHVHGGAWALGSKGGGRFARVPTDEGAAFASVQYRLSGTTSYPGPVRDVVAAVDWCREHATALDVDPERVAITGESAGGHLSSLVAMAPDVAALRPSGVSRSRASVACVVSVSGVYDFTVDPYGNGDLIRQFLGCETDACTEKRRVASPITHVDGDDPPILCYHGTDDDLVPYSQMERFQSAASDAGVDLTLVTGDGGGHVDPYQGSWGDRYETHHREFLQSNLF